MRCYPWWIVDTYHMVDDGSAAASCAEAPTIAALAEVIAAAGLRLSRPAPPLEGQLPVGAELGYSLHMSAIAGNCRASPTVRRTTPRRRAAPRPCPRRGPLRAVVGPAVDVSRAPRRDPALRRGARPDLLDEPRLLAALREALER